MKYKKVYIYILLNNIYIITYFQSSAKKLQKKNATSIRIKKSNLLYSII